MSAPNLSRVVQPYLFFNGACEEALALYRDAVGAEVLMQMRFDQAPEPPPPGTLPPGFEKKIMHASVRIGSTVLMASDGCSNTGQNFSGFSLSITVESEAAAARAFESLAVGGSIQMPLGKTFWSPCFGMLTDRFGVGWMVTVATSPTP